MNRKSPAPLVPDETSRDTGGRVRDFSQWPFPPMTRVRVDGHGSHWIGIFLRPIGSGMAEVAPEERAGTITPTRHVRVALLSRVK